MSITMSKGRQSDGKQREIKTTDNAYKYDYDTVILLYPSIAALLTSEEFHNFQVKHNEK